MLALLLLLTAADAAPPPLPYAWAEFERSGALSHVDETVAIATDGTDPRTHEIEIKLRYVTRSPRDRTILWANSRTCPALKPLLTSMHALEMPRPLPYGTHFAPGPMVIDGTGYRLRAPSSFSNGTLTITSNVGSPLAKWVDGAFATLAPCWSPVELRVDPPR